MCVFFNNPVPNPMISFSRIPLVINEYVGLNLTWRCEARIPVSQQLLGVDAVVEWRGPSGLLVSSNDGRVTLGDLVIDSPGREYRRSIQFSPLSADDMGTYSCSATVMPTVTRSGVTNGFRIRNNSLTVVGKIMIYKNFFSSYMLLHVSLLLQYLLWMCLSTALVSVLESLSSLLSMASPSPAWPPPVLLGHQHQSERELLG